MKQFYFVIPDPPGANGTNPMSNFDRELKNRWKAAVDSGVCRYRLKLQTRVLPGKYGLVVQLNSDRGTTKRKSQSFGRVNAPFNLDHFNFNKISPQEILTKIYNDKNGSSDNVMIINVSPVEFGNCLLVPNVSQNIPQRATRQGLELLIHIMLLSNDPNLRAAFGSLGAYASVNHQHFHLYYLQQRLFLEKARVEHLFGSCYALTDFPSKGFVFQLEDDPIQLARDVFILVSFLRKNEIAHNMFLTRGKRFADSMHDAYDTLRIYVWARETSFDDVKDSLGFVPSTIELAGHLQITESNAFENLTEETVTSVLEELTTPSFEFVAAHLPELYS